MPKTKRRDIHDVATEIAESLAPRLLAMTAHMVAREYGPRCPDNEAGCPCCDAWAVYDTWGICPTAEQLVNYQTNGGL